MNGEAIRKAIVTPSEISPAAESIANSVDLLTEILLRLPATHTIRFKIVSKHWLSLLSDSRFAADHYIRNPRPSISAFYFNSKGKPVPVSLHGGASVSRLSPPSSMVSENLLELRLYAPATAYCCAVIVTSQSVVMVRDGNTLSVIRPQSNPPYFLFRFHLSHTILNFSQRLTGILIWLLILQDHLTTKFCCLGMSFDSLFYCSQIKCWNKVFTKQRHYAGGSDVYWNGAFHLLSHDNGLWRFDLNTEEMTVMPNPPTLQIRTPDNIKYFGESGGSLILIQSCSRYATGLQILEMRKDYGGWMVKCRVDLLKNPEIKSEYKWEVKVLFVVKEEKENDFALVLAIPNKIVSYNLKRKTWNVRHEHGLGHDCYVKGFPFIESLSPI